MKNPVTGEHQRGGLASPELTSVGVTPLAWLPLAWLCPIWLGCAGISRRAARGEGETVWAARALELRERGAVRGRQGGRDQLLLAWTCRGGGRIDTGRSFLTGAF